MTSLTCYRVRDSAPDGSSPRVYMRLGTVGYRLESYIPFTDFLFDRVRGSAPDASSPRVYVQLGTVGHRLKFCTPYDLLCNVTACCA